MSPTDAQADEPRVPPGDTPATPPTDDERAALRRTCREHQQTERNKLNDKLAKAHHRILCIIF